MDTNAGSSLKEIQKSIQNNKSDLPSSIQNLMKMIFDIDSMQNTLLELKIDPNKMPLGFLSAELIQEGFSILSQIQKEIEDKSKDKLLGLTNQFYTLIPQNFGGRRPPLIDNTDMVQEKTELLPSNTADFVKSPILIDPLVIFSLHFLHLDLPDFAYLQK